MGFLPQQALPFPEASAVSLAAYARQIEVCECSFWGINNAPTTVCGNESCRTIWSKGDRDWVQHYLAESQYEIEQEINYFIGRRWATNERHAFARPLITDWGYVVAGGVRTVANILIGAAVDHTNDPAVVGPIATTVTDVEEVFVYHPGTDNTITPSNITIAGGFVTIEIPRCRMVKPESQDNPASGLNYNNLGNFSATVDVKRVYNLNSDPAVLIYKQCKNCEEERTNSCLYIRHATIGSVDIEASLCRSRWGCYPTFVELNYYAGRQIIESGRYTFFGRQAQDAVIRLAHVKMPHTPCDCDPVRELWRRDREVIVDSVGRPLRGVTPFGPEEGAWTAWRFANSGGMKLMKGATL